MQFSHVTRIKVFDILKFRLWAIAAAILLLKKTLFWPWSPISSKDETTVWLDVWITSTYIRKSYLLFWPRSLVRDSDVPSNAGNFCQWHLYFFYYAAAWAKFYNRRLGFKLCWCSIFFGPTTQFSSDAKRDHGPFDILRIKCFNCSCSEHVCIKESRDLMCLKLRTETWFELLVLFERSEQYDFSLSLTWEGVKRPWMFLFRALKWGWKKTL